MKTFDYKNKTVLVTGANRGLGLGCVVELLKLDFRVVACARNSEKILSELKTQNISTKNLLTRNLDVSSEPSLKDLSSFLLKDLKECHILINNAGVYLDKADGPPLSTSGEDFLKTLMTNVYGPYRLCQIVLPLMKAQGFGRIVNVSSGMGQLSEMGKGYPAYRVSKTALNALSRNLAMECEKSNILINSVCPGWVKTDMGGKNAQREIPEGVKSILWAALLPPDGPNGGYFRDGKSLSW
jgi:NAD(P)-dependent dehydrogenase (short-subunit alcohol dehydrogenase family)